MGRGRGDKYKDSATITNKKTDIQTQTDRLTQTRENTGKLCFALTSLTCSRSPASLGVRRGGAGDP